MFEERINLNVTKVDNVVEKEIYGQKVKFNKYLEQQYCELIINECFEKFIEQNNGENSFVNALEIAIRAMNICLCYLTTNINIDNISYEDLYIMGVFKNIEETLINYKEIKECVIISISLIFDYIIYDALEKLPTSKQMADNLQEMKDILTSNPEKAKEYANIIMANHPELQGFGEIFEKFLNNLNKKE